MRKNSEKVSSRELLSSSSPVAMVIMNVSSGLRIDENDISFKWNRRACIGLYRRKELLLLDPMGVLA